MRLQWAWAVVVCMGLSWAGQPGDAAWAQPTIVAGPQNPRQTLELDDGIANLSALQVSVTAPLDRGLLIDAVTIGFGLPFDEDVTTGNESLLDELRARLIIEDVEVNGIQDDGEASEGEQSVTDLEDPATVLFALNPPLSLQAGDSMTFLVIVDINQPATQAAAANSWAVALALLCPLMGLIWRACQSPSEARRYYLVALILIGCAMLPAGCATDDDDDELRFVVNLPSNGLTGDGQRLGPEQAIAGVTIRLMK
jgi:hypothetical protein